MKSLAALRLPALLAAATLLPTADAAAQAAEAPDPNLGKVSRVQWSADGKTVDFTNMGKRFRLDLETLERVEIEAPAEEPGQGHGATADRHAAEKAALEG